MKILTWNCNGALRLKFPYLLDFNADICVIQECENPIETKDIGYRHWAENHLWTGDNKNKGIGIFANEKIKLQKLHWSDNHLDQRVKYFLPCRVDQDFELLAVWTHSNNSPTFGYIGQFWKYLQVNKIHMKKILILGDLNSNVFWDRNSRWWNHSDVVRDSMTSKFTASIISIGMKCRVKRAGRPFFFIETCKNHIILIMFLGVIILKTNS